MACIVYLCNSQHYNFQMGEIILQINTIDGLQSILALKDISIIGVLLAVIVYFWYENRDLKKRVEKVIEEHQKDLKDSSKDAQVMINNYHRFMEDTRNALKGK